METRRLTPKEVAAIACVLAASFEAGVAARLPSPTVGEKQQALRDIVSFLDTLSYRKEQLGGHSDAAK